jgi:hypothetical protein
MIGIGDAEYHFGCHERRRAAGTALGGECDGIITGFPR